MRKRLATDRGAELYGKRQPMMEAVFGQMKPNRRVENAFHRRGGRRRPHRMAVAAATHNLLKLHRATASRRCKPGAGWARGPARAAATRRITTDFTPHPAPPTLYATASARAAADLVDRAVPLVPRSGATMADVVGSPWFAVERSGTRRWSGSLRGCGALGWTSSGPAPKEDGTSADEGSRSPPWGWRTQPAVKRRALAALPAPARQ